MNYDENGRDLTYQAERLAADERDDGEQRLADLLVTLFWVFAIVGPVTYALVACK